MFRSLSKSTAAMIELQLNGQLVVVPEGVSVWAAMALSGDTCTRLSSVSEEKRSAYCAMGVCFECLVEIDGQPNRQACLTPARAGMRVDFQQITESTNAVVEPVENLKKDLDQPPIYQELVVDSLTFSDGGCHE